MQKTINSVLGSSRANSNRINHSSKCLPRHELGMAAIAAGLWTYSWKWFWITLGASGALTMLIQMSLYLVR